MTPAIRPDDETTDNDKSAKPTIGWHFPPAWPAPFGAMPRQPQTGILSRILLGWRRRFRAPAQKQSYATPGPDLPSQIADWTASRLRSGDMPGRNRRSGARRFRGCSVPRTVGSIRMRRTKGMSPSRAGFARRRDQSRRYCCDAKLTGENERCRLQVRQLW